MAQKFKACLPQLADSDSDSDGEYQNFFETPGSNAIQAASPPIQEEIALSGPISSEEPEQHGEEIASPRVSPSPRPSPTKAAADGFIDGDFSPHLAPILSPDESDEHDLGPVDIVRLHKLLEQRKQAEFETVNFPLVVLLGLTRAGKSTAGAWLSGTKMRMAQRTVSAEDRNGNKYLAQEEVCRSVGDVEGFVIGHGADATTKNPSFKTLLQHSLSIADTAGFFDTEGSEVQIANGVCLYHFLKKASKGIVPVVCIQPALLQDPNYLSKLLDIVRHTFGYLDDVKDSVLCVFTRPSAHVSVKTLSADLISLRRATHLPRRLIPLVELALQQLTKHGDTLIVRPDQQTPDALLCVLRELRPVAASRVTTVPISTAAREKVVAAAKNLEPVLHHELNKMNGAGIKRILEQAAELAESVPDQQLAKTNGQLAETVDMRIASIQEKAASMLTTHGFKELAEQLDALKRLRCCNAFVQTDVDAVYQGLCSRSLHLYQRFHKQAMAEDAALSKTSDLLSKVKDIEEWLVPVYVAQSGSAAEIARHVVTCVSERAEQATTLLTSKYDTDEEQYQAAFGACEDVMRHVSEHVKAFVKHPELVAQIDEIGRELAQNVCKQNEHMQQQVAAAAAAVTSGVVDEYQEKMLHADLCALNIMSACTVQEFMALVNSHATSVDLLMGVLGERCKTVVAAVGDLQFEEAVVPWKNVTAVARVPCAAHSKLHETVHGALLSLVDQIRAKQSSLLTITSYSAGSIVQAPAKVKEASALISYLSQASVLDELLVSDPWQARPSARVVQDAVASLSTCVRELMTSCVGTLNSLDTEGAKRALEDLMHYKHVAAAINVDWSELRACLQKNVEETWASAGTQPSELGSDLRALDMQSMLHTLLMAGMCTDEWSAPLLEGMGGHQALVDKLSSNRHQTTERIEEQQELIVRELSATVETLTHGDIKDHLDTLKLRADLCEGRPLRLMKMYTAACKQTSDSLSLVAKKAVQAYQDADFQLGQQLLSGLERCFCLVDHFESVEDLVSEVTSSYSGSIEEMKRRMDRDIERQRFGQTLRILQSLKDSAQPTEQAAFRSFSQTIVDAYEDHHDKLLKKQAEMETVSKDGPNLPFLPAYVTEVSDMHRVLHEFSKLDALLPKHGLAQGAEETRKLLVILAQFANQAFEVGLERFKFAHAYEGFRLLLRLSSIEQVGSLPTVSQLVRKATQARDGLHEGILRRFEDYIQGQNDKKIVKLLYGVKKAADSKTVVFQAYLFEDVWEELQSIIATRFNNLMDEVIKANVDDRYKDACANMQQLKLLEKTGCLSESDIELIAERRAELSDVVLLPLQSRNSAKSWLEQLERCKTAMARSATLSKMKAHIDESQDKMPPVTLDSLGTNGETVEGLQQLINGLEGHSRKAQILISTVNMYMQTLCGAMQAVIEKAVAQCFSFVDESKYTSATRSIARLLPMLNKLKTQCSGLQLDHYIATLEDIVEAAESRQSIFAFGSAPADSCDILSDFDVLSFEQRLLQLEQARMGDGAAAYGKFVAHIKAQLAGACAHLTACWKSNKFKESSKPLFNLRRIQTTAFMHVDGPLVENTIAKLVETQHELVGHDVTALRQLRVKGTAKQFNDAMERAKEIDKYLDDCKIAPQVTGTIVDAMSAAAREAKKDLEEFRQLNKGADGDDAVIEMLAAALVKIYGITDDIADVDVCSETMSELHTLASLLESHGSTQRLAEALADRGVRGQELIQALPHFARARAALLNQRTAHVTIDTALDELVKASDKRFKFKAEDADKLKELYTTYEHWYKMYLDKCLSPDKLEQHIADTREEFQALRSKTSGRFDSLRPSLVKLIARVTPVWSVTASKGHLDLMNKPHAVQILTLFMMLGLHQTHKKTQQKSKEGKVGKAVSWLLSFLPSHLSGQLAQILTGEGKTLLLGLLATVLGLLGMPSRCVCYSSYLSKRDYDSFSFMFKHFKVKEMVKYGTFEEMCEDLVNLHGDIRKQTEAVIEGRPRQFPFESECAAKPVLLVDEVDAFYQPALFGSTYNPCVTFMDKDRHLATLILAIADNPRMSFGDVKALPAYAELVKALPHAVSLLDKELAAMIKDVRALKNHVYQVHNGKIAYKTHGGTLSTSIHSGYFTLFAYISEHRKGAVTEEEMRNRLGLSLICGNYSYAKLPCEFECIMGVTGTLDCLVPLQQTIMKKEYNIQAQHRMPSIFGSSELKWSREEDIKMLKTRDRHFQAIAKRAATASASNAAVLIFFRDDAETQAFVGSNYAKLIQDDKLRSITSRTENIGFYVTKATVSGTVSCWPREYGRGLDFIVNDRATREAGGVVVIQTFVSEDPSEEVQIRGRTARSTDEGRYELILCQADVMPQLDLTAAEISRAMDKKNLYKLLHEKRIKLFETQLDELVNRANAARKQHEFSVRYLEQVWADGASQAELLKLLEDLQ